MRRLTFPGLLGWTAPERHLCAMMRFVEDFIKEEPSVDQITRIGMDTSKRFFQLHGVDAEGRPALRRQLTRAQVLPFFEKLASTLVAMEACGAAHHWARALTRLGHEVRLIAPQLAKPYVARGKNDAADAAALCEAASRPHMRFVPAKSTDEQAALMLAGQPERLVRQRAQFPAPEAELVERVREVLARG